MRRHYLSGLISPMAKRLTPHELLFTSQSVLVCENVSLLLQKTKVSVEPPSCLIQRGETKIFINH